MPVACFSVRPAAPPACRSDPPLRQGASLLDQWVDLSEWPNYQINRLGQVKSLGRTIIEKNGKRKKLKEKILKTSTKHGRCVALRRDGETFVVRVGRLVLLTFVGDPPKNKPLACHVDDNIRNNALSNMVWGNKSSNHFDARRNKRIEYTEQRNQQISQSLKRFYAAGGKCR